MFIDTIWGNGIICLFPMIWEPDSNKERKMTMKKLIALLLALVMLLPMTACGGSIEPTQTTTVSITESVAGADVETTPEASEETEYIGLAEEWLQSEDTVTVRFETPKEYEELLYELGYTEFRLNYYVDMSFSQLACVPISLTYNSKVFRFDFDYWDNPVVNGVTDFSRDVLKSGIVLYGTKAESALNITHLNFDNYDVAHPMNWIEMVAPKSLMAMDGCPQIVETSCFDMDERGNQTNWAYHAYNYYPFTGNLYNFVHVAASMEDAQYDSPRLLQSWNEALMDVWDANETPRFTLVTGILTNEGEIIVGSGGHIALSITEYCFEKGMSLQDWAKSGYNLDGWRYIANDKGGVLYSPEKNYVIMAGPDGSLPVTQTGGFYEVVMLTYDDYCKLTGKY